MGADEISGQLSSFWPYEAVIVSVDDKTKELTVREGVGSALSVIPPLSYGGSGNSGVFSNPNVGDRVLCVRVDGGSRGIVQPIKLIPRVSGKGEAKQGDYVRAGTTDISTLAMGEEDIRILSHGGGQLSLAGDPNTSSIFLGNDKKSGFYVNERDSDVKITIVARNQQVITSGHRMTSGVSTRFNSSNVSTNASKETGNELLAFHNCVDGDEMGLYPGSSAQTVGHTGSVRNPPISEYRLVINEMAEHSGYSGWDEESGRKNSKEPFVKTGFATKSLQRSIGLNNALHLAPHQLIEIIGGNVLSYRGEVLDPNYGTVEIGDADGVPPSGALDYEKDRLLSRRGIGYHFQLSTNSVTTKDANDTENLVYAIDKEGILKISVPKSSSTGNVLYPTAAEFYHKSGGVLSKPAKKSESEKVPVTLRDAENNVVYPPSAAESSMFGSGSGDTSYSRQTGVRYTNSESYFHNLKSIDQAGNIRVNSTKHHNMYAAAEMLIANLINASKIPYSTTKCPGIVLGNSIGQPFERPPGGIAGSGDDPNDVTYMSTVEVSPGPPAIDPGGGVIVAGRDLTASVDLNNTSINVPYTNSFTVSQSESGFTSANADASGSTRKASGGKSANLNFEGSLEVSVGKDNHDEKSIVLDTAGSLVAWFGIDSNGRSMIVQTDGGVMFNVGGRTGDSFIPGRFDLRVNVVDKGYLGQDDYTPRVGGDPVGAHASDYIISISDSGLVIAGMNPGMPMIIRNDGNLTLESTAKLILAGNSIEQRIANRTPKAPGRQDSQDDPAASPSTDPLENFENVAESISCIQTVIGDMID